MWTSALVLAIVFASTLYFERQAMQALSHWDLEGLSCLYSRENAVYCTDKTVEVSQLFAGVTLIRE